MGDDAEVIAFGQQKEKIDEGLLQQKEEVEDIIKEKAKDKKETEKEVNSFVIYFFFSFFFVLGLFFNNIFNLFFLLQQSFINFLFLLTEGNYFGIIFWIMPM